MLLIIATAIKPAPAKADLFGGDVVVLTQILANAIQQLMQLKQIVGAGQDTLSLLTNINQGLNYALNIMNTISPATDPGLYKDWRNVPEAMRRLREIYGIVAPSPEQTVQQNTDQSIAEAVSLNNSMYDYSNHLDSVGEQIKQFSRQVSPTGAQKLTAQTLGIMLHAMNQNLRAQATSLKLQAQALAIENNHNKAMTRYTLANNHALNNAIKDEQVEFKVPRF